jgi:hypothetical protein
MNAFDKLRFAVMLNGFECQKWQAKAVEHLLNDSRIELCLLILKQSSSLKQAKPISRFRDKHLLLKAYRKFHLKIDSLKPVVPDWLATTPQLLCEPIEKGYSHYFEKDDISRIQSHRPDFVLRFGFNILRGSILNVAPLGIWSFHHGDEQNFRGGPPGFWEIMHNRDVTGAILQRLTPVLDSGIILKKGYFKTIKHSWPESFEQLLHNTSIWPLQVAKDILNGHLNPNEIPAATTLAPVYRFPNNWQMLRFLVRQLKNKLRFHHQELFKPEHWNIGVIDRQIESMLNNEPLQIKWLPDLPSSKFLADGFGFVHKGKKHIVAEHFDYRTLKGNLVALEDQGNHIPFFEKSPHHHSYPFIFEHDGNTYCLPESYEQNRLDLLLWEPEIRQFKFVKTLIDKVEVIDPTLININEVWWLFCTHRSLSNTLLYLYHAPSPFGPFEPHQNNPVKCDIQSSRPAGSVFAFAGKWYRPAQDCAQTYGHRVVIHEITEISPQIFKEVAVKTIEAQAPYGKGLHTLSRFGNQTLVDGKVFRFNWPNFIRQLKRKLRLTK